MEETATCDCTNQTWRIYADHIECAECHRVYRFSASPSVLHSTKASDIVHLVNDDLPP